MAPTQTTFLEGRKAGDTGQGQPRQQMPALGCAKQLGPSPTPLGSPPVLPTLRFTLRLGSPLRGTCTVSWHEKGSRGAPRASAQFSENRGALELLGLQYSSQKH